MCGGQLLKPGRLQTQFPACQGFAKGREGRIAATWFASPGCREGGWSATSFASITHACSPGTLGTPSGAAGVLSPTGGVHGAQLSSEGNPVQDATFASASLVSAPLPYTGGPQVAKQCASNTAPVSEFVTGASCSAFAQVFPQVYPELPYSLINRVCVKPKAHRKINGVLNKVDKFVLQIESYNSSGLRSLKARLLATSSNIVLAQETGIHDEIASEVQSWAHKNGWDMIHEPAIRCRQNYSCGVAVFVKSPLGVRRPPTPVALGQSSYRRVVRALVDIPGWDLPLGCNSGYLKDTEGLGYVNSSILDDLAMLSNRNESCLEVTGCDWNNSVVHIASSGYPLRARMQLLSSTEATCISSNSNSVIDFFALCPEAMMLFDTLSVDNNWHKNPHKPVVLKFLPNAHTVTRLVAVKPPSIPTLLPYGPSPAPPDWKLASSLASIARNTAINGTVVEAVEALRLAYQSWANTAEIELVNVAGCETSKF